MLQQQQPEDFVIATGVQFSVREFVQRAAAELGITVAFSGEGEHEVGTVAAVIGDKATVQGRRRDRASRPALLPAHRSGNAAGRSLARPSSKLGWTPATTLAELVHEMVDSDYVAAKRDSLVKLAGYQAFDYHE